MVILRASYIVKAAEQTAKRLMSLSEFDQVAAITHSTLVFFYRSNNSYDFDSAGRILKDSLSKALVTFYPLAGRLHLTGRDRFELDCNSMGARLLVAESNAKIEDFGDFRPSPQLQALVPHVDYSMPFHEIPLLMLQLTKLSEGGLCLGIAISHIMADAGSAFHFINELAKIARGEESNNPPFFDRTILQAEESSPPLSFKHLEYCPPPLLVGRSDAEDEQREETTVGMLKLTREQIEKLVAKANKGQTGENPARAYTKFEAMAGHVWRCASKARKHMTNQQLTRLYFPVDVRKRVEPKLPPGYFGNAVCRAAASSMSRELQSQPLCFASSKIREAINMVSDVYVRSSLRFLKNHQHLSQHRTSHAPGSVQGVFHGNPNMVINTLEKVPISDADYGWGKLIHMGPTAIGSDGKSLIMPCLDEDGSFNILFRLQVAYMEDFLKFFYADI